MSVAILRGDCRDVLPTLPERSVHCCVTSPPYWGLRDYGVERQIGLEPTVHEWVAVLVAVFREVRRVLRDDGTCWVNLGDSYATGTKGGRLPTQAGKHGYWENPAISHRIDGRESGLKPKDLIGQPWLLAFAMRADGWWLRQDIIWSKPNPMPESIRDRCTKAHEYVFLLSKSERYYYDFEAMQEPVNGGAHARRPDSGVGFSHGFDAEPKPRYKTPDGWDMPATRNKRSVWTVASKPFKEAHFATFPPALIEPCIRAGCPVAGTVLDPFGGAGTTGMVADRLQRNALLIELNPEYSDMADRRIVGDAPMFAEVTA